jgi:tRNA(fMet)-specific endonuclease VapC
MEEREMILCDTDIPIEFYRNNQGILTTLQEIGQNNIAISVITSGELIYGALNKKELKQIRRNINSLLEFSVNDDISFTFIELLEKYSLSHNLEIADAIIAATAISKNIPLFTLNKKDYRFIIELKLYE